MTTDDAEPGDSIQVSTAGGFRLWQDIVEPHDRPAPPVWRVIS
jgi:hypothetical protein